jgi:hypothetical protein
MSASALFAAPMTAKLPFGQRHKKIAILEQYPCFLGVPDAISSRDCVIGLKKGSNFARTEMTKRFDAVDALREHGTRITRVEERTSPIHR